MTGTQARENYEQAQRLVKEHHYEEALAMELLPSDRKLIERDIAAAKAREVAA